MGMGWPVSSDKWKAPLDCNLNNLPPPLDRSDCQLQLYFVHREAKTPGYCHCLKCPICVLGVPLSI